MANSFAYGGNTILSSPIFVETILPFLLVFTIVFAVLQKSKILGDGKKQIDAIVALVIGLLVISFGQATGVIIQLTYFLAVALVIILVAMILIGSFTEQGKFFDTFPSGLRWVLIVGSMVAVAVAVLIITGIWETIYAWAFLSSDSGIVANIIFILIVVVAVIFVILSAKGGSESG